MATIAGRMARRPDLTRFHDYQIQTGASVDRVQQVQQILREHDYGTFQRSAELVEQMMMDDRISAVIDTRIAALLGTPLEFKAAEDKRKPRKIAEELGGTDDVQGVWRESAPQPVLREILKWGLLLGVAVAEKVWERSSRKWVPRLVSWHPQFVRWDWQSRRFVLQTQEGMILLPRPDEQPRADEKWVVWCPFGVQYGWRSALLRPLALRYIARGWTFRDYARYCEKHGLAVWVAKTPADAQADDKATFFQQTANMGADAAVLAPEGYDINLREATARSWEAFQTFKKELDTDIAITVLGQNLTTEVQGGSYAAAQVQNLVRIDKARFDADLGPTLTQQLWSWWTEFNHGDPALTPRAEFQVDPPEDEAAEANALKLLGDAALSLSAASDRVDVDAILEANGVPLLSEEEVEAQREDEPEPPPPPPGETDEDGKPEDGDAQAEEPQEAALSALGVLKRYDFAGLPIAVENPTGSTRFWRDESGKLGWTEMLYDYGFIEGVCSGDEDELDVYVGPDPGAPEVHIVHQLKAPDFKRWDEDKTMLGFADAADAKAAFLAHRNDGERAYGGMTSMPLSVFKKRLQRRSSESTSKIRATAPAKGTALAKTAAGKRRAARYTDKLEARAKARAAAALRPDLEAIKREVDVAKDFDELRDRLVKRFKGMDPKRLSQVLFRARVMANLAGRAAAIEEA